MAKHLTRYRCTSCGYASAKPLGRCPSCGAWNAFVEDVATITREKASLPPAALTKLADVRVREEPRVSSGVPELDRVLGGGIVAGSVVLLGGEPGIGKSTLLLQVADHLVRQAHPVLYVAGEESLEQVRLRAERLALLEGLGGDLVMTRDTNAHGIAALVAEHTFRLVIIDSIQTVRVDEDGTPGSLAQVREATAQLTRMAKETGAAVVLVGHVTKDGTVAGPKVMEHIVDVTLYLESVGHYRLLRSAKNRFGSVGELGVFEMRENGLWGVENPSAAFLAERPVGVPGSIVAATMDGQRPLLLEVQALAAKTPYPSPKRVAVGLDPRRVDVVLAVLERRLELSLAGLDVYVNLAGGLRLIDPGLDLAVALAVYSAIIGRPFPEQAVAFGEVGLAGEVRTVSQPSRRAAEARRVGFDRLIAPAREGEGGVRNVREAVRLLWGEK